MVEVVEFYTNWEPPRGVRTSVSGLLASIPTKYTAGLGRVVLANASGMPRRRGRQKVGRGRSRSRTDQVLGLYHQRRGAEPAWIELFMDRIFNGCPSWAARLPIVRDALIAGTLYHELGHHIEATKRPEHCYKETVAEDWSGRLSRLHLRRRYWYVRLISAVLTPLWRRRKTKGRAG